MRALSAPAGAIFQTRSTIFKGALEGRATQITEEMKLAAAAAIAGLVPDEALSEDNIMPEAFDPKVAELVAQAVRSHIRP